MYNGLTHTLFSWIKMVLTHILQFFSEKLAFLREIFRPFLSNVFNKSSSFIIWDCFEGLNNIRSSLIASQYFLLSKQLRIVYIYDCHIGRETFNPIGILLYKYEALPKYGKIPQYFFELPDNLKEWNASFKSNTKSNSYYMITTPTGPWRWTPPIDRRMDWLTSWEVWRQKAD